MEEYSDKSLVEKLGIKPYSRIFIINPPVNYFQILGDLPERVELKKELVGSANLIQYFSKNREVLAVQFQELASRIQKDGSLWICWPKKSSKIRTDLDENIIREIGLEEGMVDIKVCAIDEDWSGLKFVYRVSSRN